MATQEQIPGIKLHKQRGILLPLQTQACIAISYAPTSAVYPTTTKETHKERETPFFDIQNRPRHTS